MYPDESFFILCLALSGAMVLFQLFFYFLAIINSVELEQKKRKKLAKRQLNQ